MHWCCPFLFTKISYLLLISIQILETLFALYSTFASIYYSYNNPIVSYYDYQDYLSNYGKSLTNSAVDTVDVEFENGDGNENENSSTSQAPMYNGWTYRTQHVLQFILDAIEKGKASNSQS